MLLEKQEIQTTLYEFTGIKNIDIQRLSVKRAELFEMWRKLSFYAKKSKIKRSKIISYKDSCCTFVIGVLSSPPQQATLYVIEFIPPIDEAVPWALASIKFPEPSINAW